MEEPVPTRMLLKVFGVSVTDFEAESARILDRAAAAGSERELLRDAAELVAEVQGRWLEVTRRLFEEQGRFLQRLAAAAGGSAKPSV